jgi:hypothetical protein
MISGGGGAGPGSETPARIGLRDEVFIWRAELDRSGWELESLTALLSASERQRGDRFHFERDRRRFLAARGMLRKLLSGYTGVPPEELEFTLEWRSPVRVHPRRRRRCRHRVYAVRHRLYGACHQRLLALGARRTRAAAGIASDPSVLRVLDSQGSVSQGARRRSVGAAGSI